MPRSTPPHRADDTAASSEGRPSKSKRKRDSAALQDLGVELLALSGDQLEAMGLPAPLLEAVRAGQSITQHGALKRQRKFIGKLLRGLDAEPIRAALAQVRQEGIEAARLQHRIEGWRERLLEEGDIAIDALVADHLGADRQKLRQLVSSARRERERDLPPRSSRLLFRYLREIFASTTNPPVGP